MANVNPDVAWFQKYRPKQLEDLVFETEDFKALVQKWIENKNIDGNLLLFGPHGKGKTTLSRILINEIIKNKNDLYTMASRSVKEIDEIAIWIRKKPIASQKKIVYIEEFDKLSDTALTQLKDTLMEDFQSYCTFICTTNHPNKIPDAVLDRFNHRIGFEGKNIEGVKNRFKYILDNENAKYELDKLNSFVEKNAGQSYRKLISNLQFSFISHNGEINFSDIEKNINVEEDICKLLINMIHTTMSINSPAERRKCTITPMDSEISKDYYTFVSILHNNYELNYDSIFENVYDKISFIPLKLIIANYFEKSDYKKWAHVHLIACWHECMKCAMEILM